MKNGDYEKILNALPETGVYVIRESDRSILYFNKKVQEVSPGVRLGVACDEVWAGTCECCPLLTIAGRQESRTVSYNAPYGGVVDITATRTVWEGSVPAFVLTVAPRFMAAGYTYRKILRVDFASDRCDVLKSDPDSWWPNEKSLSVNLIRFAQSGAVHPGDMERFQAFTRIDNLRAAAQGDAARSLVYRRRAGDLYRWNLMEVIPDPIPSGESSTAVLCVKDVHDVLREGLEREGAGERSQELIRSLGEQNFSIYTIDITSGLVEPIRVDGQMRDPLSQSVQPWNDLMRTHIVDRLHSAYQDEFERRFSLAGLRQAKQEGQQKIELLCQWRCGEDYRYISSTAYLGREAKGYTVLALQDVDDRMRRELAHTQRDMRMAAILKSRFKMLNTVHLDTGICERVTLDEDETPQDTLVGDYSQYILQAVTQHVRPEDADRFWSLLSLEHLREKAKTVEDYAEEVCCYRLCGEPTRWIELHIIYSQERDGVMVNILGQDITREKHQEEDRLQALEDRAYIISSLSSLFFSTYYIDMETDSFRAVTQPRRVGDVLGGEVNYTAALKIYANNFVHPDDRDAYLETMSVENLRGKLRWWQPCVALEFRLLPEAPESGKCSWVRATAVLAKTGEDDLPKKVVYVAQDITETKRSSV